MIYGNIEGIRKTTLDKLENLYDINVPKYEILTEDILNIMCNISSNINREISIAISRKGGIIGVSIGDSTTVELPIIDSKEGKLSGIRVVHTHPNGNSRLSAIDMSALTKLKLDCIAAIGVLEDGYTDISLGFCGIKDNVLEVETYNTLTFEQVVNFNFLDKIKLIEEEMKKGLVIETSGERAILVGIDSNESLDELEELAKACNIEVVHKVLQKKDKIDTAFYIGSGKVEEIALLRQALRANILIFDDELSGSQVRNLENLTGVKVIDRTTLILDIFARRARSKEAKIQVELAQLKYRLPRLTGLGAVLSRTGGGIGTRGPGEKKLETDKRHIRESIYDLQRELEKTKKTREVQREKRIREDIPKVSLVGYTNAGKSTLRNKICDFAASKDLVKKEKVFEADMLFATLDTTTRAIILPDNRIATLTDTVGFVRKLPHDLVEAFKSTLEEVIYSDILLHVVDASSEYVEEQIKAVNEVLDQLEAHDKPLILVINKIDKASEEQIDKIKMNNSQYTSIEISAKEGINLETLLQIIIDNLPNKQKRVKVVIPYSDQNIVAYLYRNSNIIEESYEEEGTAIIAEVNEEVYNKCNSYIIEE